MPRIVASRAIRQSPAPHHRRAFPTGTDRGGSHAAKRSGEAAPARAGSRIRRFDVRGHPRPRGGRGVFRGPPQTISIGCALARSSEPAAELMKRADEMLYAAKRSGRNRVCL
ncbi:MAG: diguanylate cyclase [Deltaproteobacteria bacterium]|nr:diguanylate cyclase [Deltaproteobacteria bacterium]